MKKIFLLIGIAAFSGVSAQQKDLFDIQQHLQKKQEDNRNAAQKKNTPFPNYNLYSGNNQKSSYTLLNGNKIFSSLAGRMPCVRPDMRNFQVMPNLADGKLPPNSNYYPQNAKPWQIPNESRPYRMIVSK